MKHLLIAPLGKIFFWCYTLAGSFGLAIILFTLFTKVILLPLSLWIHKNSIKVVRLQPELNHLKSTHFGDPDTIAEKTAELYKREKYNPFASVIPLLIQLVLLVGLIQVIYHPFDNILRLDEQSSTALVQTTIQVTGIDPESSSIQLAAVEAVQSGQYTEEFSGIPENVLNSVQNINLSFLGLDLASVPVQNGGILLLIPLLAGAAALLLCLIQNRLNPLQAEQGKWGKLGTTAFSVGLSLFLGAFVPAGVGFYWIWSNLFTIVQQYLLNWLIDPKKAIDYEALEKSKAELAGLQNIGGKRKLLTRDPNAKREKADYKRFFSIANKHLVFYSEKSGFYKYYESVIDYLLSHSNIVIHYITSDPNDLIFEKANAQPHIKPYYIGEKKLITLMMKMDADMVVMTVPGIENHHLKRSYVRKDIEYLYMFHYPLSTHMVLPKEALHHYDTIFCVGDFQVSEIRETEKLYELPEKKLVVVGYGVLEKMREDYLKIVKVLREQPKVLIAPSWQQDNILDSCLGELLPPLLGAGFHVVVRPHPEYVKRYTSRMDAIVEKHRDYTGQNLTFELDFASSSSITESDVIITDWSGTAYEFAFVTRKPALFINTPPKINNPDYNKISAEPLELSLRSEIGVQLELTEAHTAVETVRVLLDASKRYEEKISALAEKYIANWGSSGEAGGRYILARMKEIGERKKHES